MRAKFVFEKFTEEGDPIHDMKIGLIDKIEKWIKSVSNCFRPKNIRGFGFDKYNVLDYIKINDDCSIDVANCDVWFYNLDFYGVDNFPSYIKFNQIDGNFVISESKKFKSLEGFPKIVNGNVTFIKNGIRPSEQAIRNICDVKGNLMLKDWQSEEKSKSNKKYRALGPLSQRKTHILDNTGTKIFSKGYKLWKILDFINDAGTSGRRYTDIVKFSYEMSYGKGAFHSIKNKGYWSGAFTYGMITRKTTKNSIGNYILNKSGIDYLDKHRSYFDDKIKY